MALWLIRAGKHGGDEDMALSRGLVVIGWRDMPDLSGITSFEKMKEKCREVYPDRSPRTIASYASQLWTLLNRMKKGDLVVLPLKTRSAIAVGRITGDYEYLDGRHTRRVKWLKEVPRNDFGQDLLYSFGALMTVCQIRRNNAEERVAAIAAGKPDPYMRAGRTAQSRQSAGGNGEEAGEDDQSFVDLEEQAFDQIRRLIESRFKGHNLTRLVEAILNVQGYHTYMSPAGPDGGVDILAGFGPMGFDRPRICVQVKSGGVQSDSAIRELEGVMSRVGAEQGLFVSWDGFNRTALSNTRDLFFKVRLWDDKKLIENLLNTYEKLPDEIQAELPLKRIWVVVTEED